MQLKCLVPTVFILMQNLPKVFSQINCTVVVCYSSLENVIGQEREFNDLLRNYLNTDVTPVTTGEFNLTLSIKSCLPLVILKLTCSNCFLNLLNDELFLNNQSNHLSREVILVNSTSNVSVSWTVSNCSISENNFSLILMYNDTLIWKESFSEV